VRAQPICQSKFNLAVSLKTAKALGLDVPVHLQQIADRNLVAIRGKANMKRKVAERPTLTHTYGPAISNVLV
jgi:hypothetical protein